MNIISKSFLFVLLIVSFPALAQNGPYNTPKATVLGGNNNSGILTVGTTIMAQNISCCAIPSGTNVLAVLLLPVYWQPTNNSPLNHSNSGNPVPGGYAMSGDNIYGTWVAITSTNQSGIGLFKRVQ